MDINTYKPDIIKYLPEILQRVQEYAALCKSENPEFILLWNAVKDTLHDQFLDTLTINGVERWEKILNISPVGDLANRRLEIKARFNEDGNFTFKKLQQSLNAICGENEYTCDLDVENYRLTVRIKLTSRNEYDSVDALLTRVTPANLIIDLDLAYNQHITVGEYAHIELGTFTHFDIKENPLFSTPSVLQVGEMLFVHNTEVDQNDDELILGE